MSEINVVINIDPNDPIHRRILATLITTPDEGLADHLATAATYADFWESGLDDDGPDIEGEEAENPEAIIADVIEHADPDDNVPALIVDALEAHGHIIVTLKDHLWSAQAAGNA